MELRHLRAFVAVAEELHFGRAAARLHVAQPPLSQQIRQLERELGVQLFDRNTRRVRLTTAGESFIEPARRVLTDVDEASRAAAAAGQGIYGRVSIGFAGASSRDYLPLLTRAVRTRYPQIELALQGQIYAKIAQERVADGSLDLGFVRLPSTYAGIETRLIHFEQLVCALPLDHPLASRTTISLGDLADEPFVSFPANLGSSLRDAMVTACADAGYTPKIVQAAPDSYTILALVAAGVGVTLTLTSCQHIQQVGLTYRPLAGKPQHLRIGLAWRADNSSAALRTVLSVAEEALPIPPEPA